MKKLTMWVSLWVGLLCTSPIHAFQLEEFNLEREIDQAIAREDVYSAYTKYLMALADLQHNANWQIMDAQGWIEGVWPAMLAYERAVEGKAYLAKMEVYAYLNTRLATSQGKKQTVAEYMMDTLRDSLKSQEKLQKKEYNAKRASVIRKYKRRLRNLRQDQELYVQYVYIVPALFRARAALHTLTLESDLAQGKVAATDLTNSQEQQVLAVLDVLRPVVKALEQGDVKLLQRFPLELRKAPLQTKNNVTIALAPFLLQYAAEANGHEEADRMAAVGLKMCCED